MISLDKYTYFMITAKMYMLGFTFYKELDSYYEEWINLDSDKTFRIENKTGIFSEEELLDILKEAEIDVNIFSDM